MASTDTAAPVQTPPEEAPAEPSPIQQPHPAIALLKDAALWAVITFILMLPVVGFKTVARGGRYQFDGIANTWFDIPIFRMDVVLGIAVFVFFGRILLNLTIWRKPKTATARAASGRPWPARIAWRRRQQPPRSTPAALLRHVAP